jgi:hypothetical protein
MSSPRSTLRRRSFASLAAAACVAAVVLVPSGAGAAIVATVPLGTASQYAVLAGSTVTNTGPSVLNGSLGLAPGTSVTGFPPGTVVPPATTNIANAAAQQAQSDLTAAYLNAAGRPLDATTTADLGNLILQGGVYAAPSKGALSLTGSLTLDGAGNPDSVFIFQTDSTLTTSTGSTINLINGAQACNVFWQVGSSATLGTGSVFVGDILALTSISLNDSVTVQGRALARNGAVTLINDTFNPTVCAAQVPTTTTSTTSTTSTTVPATTTVPAAPTTLPDVTAPTTAPVAPTGSGTVAGPTSGGGTTTSTAQPGAPRGDLPRTGSVLGLTFLVGLALVTVGSGAVRLSRRDT